MYASGREAPMKPGGVRSRTAHKPRRWIAPVATAHSVRKNCISDGSSRHRRVGAGLGLNDEAASI